MSKKNQIKIDYALLLIVGALLAFGLAALYSASTVESYKKFGNTTYYITHQLANGVLIGLVGMYICYKLDYHYWQKWLPWIIVISLALLAAVKLSSFGSSAGGAARWLNLGFVTFQPSEIAKLAIIFYLASWIDKKHKDLNDFAYGVLPSLVIIGLFAGLIIWQPDMGTMLVLIAVSVSMLFVAGIDWQYFLWTILAGILGLLALVKFEPYRARRITSFINPAIDPQGISYHINQALLAIGAGQLWGYGYGLSRQKYNYLPEVMGDSIFAVIAEELGFIRVVLLLLLFVIFAVKGFSIAKNAPDDFGRLTAFGITIWITAQALINIGAMVKILPLTGIPLPFFSYGSTALLLNLSAVGILLNIAKQSPAR